MTEFDVSKAAQSSLLAMSEPLMKAGKDSIVDGLSHAVPRLAADAVGSFASAFATAFLKALLQSDDSLKRVERSVSKLVAAPMKTALEQFRVAMVSSAGDDTSASHQESRFRDCLKTLDGAYALAEQGDLPQVNLLRGLCALCLPGALREAGSRR